MGLISLIKNWKLIGSVLFIGALIMSLSLNFVQSDRNTRSKEQIKRLEQDISNLERAVALTEKLRTDNANLAQERDALQKALENAEGYSDSLSDDIRRIIERLHERAIPDSTSPGSVSR